MSTTRYPEAAADRNTARGALIALALAAYGILAKRQARKPLAQDSSRRTSEHGAQTAPWPSAIPKRSLWNILMRVKADISQKNLSFIAAGVAFYGFVAIPSAIAVLVSLWSFTTSPSTLQRQVVAMQPLLPGAALQLLAEPHSSQALGISLLVGLALDLWSVHSGSSCMLTAFDLAYGEKKKRKFVKRQAVVLMLSVMTVVFAVASLALVAVLPAALDLLPFGDLQKTIISIARWPVLVALIMTLLATIYRYAPESEGARWRWLSWGTLTATVLWIVGSALFSIYVSEFSSYDESYGALGAVVVLLMWLYLSAFVVLLGARIDAETANPEALGAVRAVPARFDGA